jgi:hypothetical protein
MTSLRSLPWTNLALFTLLAPLAVSGCLVTVDIVDDRDDETGDGDGDGDPGDGDGDPGDGDGDPGDGDGDPGDGDGDPGDGDGDPGDGDGDPGDGDGDPGECVAMDAMTGPAPCALPLGWAFDGEACILIMCECEGSECDGLFEEQADCEAEYAECLPSPDCEPDDAAGEGPCDAFFGYAWDGQSCVGISGCNCVGADCADLSFDPVACEFAHSHCEG